LTKNPAAEKLTGILLPRVARWRHHIPQCPQHSCSGSNAESYRTIGPRLTASGVLPSMAGESESIDSRTDATLDYTDDHDSMVLSDFNPCKVLDPISALLKRQVRHELGQPGLPGNIAER